MTDLRIGTWNVQYARGVEKNKARLAHLRSWEADVWVLTETHDELDLSPTHTAIHSGQRYQTPGGRWTTIWTRLPVIETLSTGDPHRCVAALLDAGEAGRLIVYGTVLPWNGDTGPDPAHPARGWQRFPEVVPAQGAEWASLRERFPEAALVVAGDLNQDLGGRHYYGTKPCRALLTTHLEGAGLTCLTTTDRFSEDVLAHPPIDHVCGAPGRGRSFTTRAHGWNNVIGGVSLSDHGGTLVSFDVEEASPRG